MANILASILGLVSGIFLIVYSLKALKSGSVSVPIQRRRYTRHWYGTWRIRWIGTAYIEGWIAKFVSILYLLAGVMLLGVVMAILSVDDLGVCCIALAGVLIPLQLYLQLQNY